MLQAVNILIVHQNFPGQFKHLAPALVRQGHNVAALHMRKLERESWQGVRLIRYRNIRGSSTNIHPWAADIETKIIRGEACFRAALKLRLSGFQPDVILAHPGWGESLYLKEVWPGARMGIYCELYYRAEESEYNFDPEFPVADPDGEPSRLSMKNLNSLVHLQFADAGISPTRWQADSFPSQFQNRITVIHDGIDTELLQPNPAATLQVANNAGSNVKLTRDAEVITFVNRNLEPYRGYHIFMRSLPELLKQRPRAQVVIVGADGLSYGAAPDRNKHGNRSWKQVFADEVRPQINEEDWSRVYFTGRLDYPDFVSLLQLSTVHVYLTYPFVLSWSLLEAMSTGAAIVASDTLPVREALQHDQTARLFDFFDIKGLIEEVCRLLDNPAERDRLGANAREFARKHYDLKSVCLPRQLLWVEELARDR